ncbi:MAG: hypothetical protein Q4P66_08620 [Actinomycetaceae bacterium]|nr:hypothetical protein [Actinomycetaceae bacterium]
MWENQVETDTSGLDTLGDGYYWTHHDQGASKKDKPGQDKRDTADTTRR